MSLNSLASSKVARDIGAKEPLTSATDDVGAGAKDVQNALSALIEYIPAETITLYLAVASALPVLQRCIVGVTPKNVYWTFSVLTLLLFALIYAGKRKAQGGSRWPGLKKWPWWPMIAATIAFMSWGLTAPNRPYLTGEDGDALVGLFAIIASTLLGVLARFLG